MENSKVEKNEKIKRLKFFLDYFKDGESKLKEEYMLLDGHMRMHINNEELYNTLLLARGLFEDHIKTKYSNEIREIEMELERLISGSNYKTYDLSGLKYEKE